MTIIRKSAVIKKDEHFFNEVHRWPLREDMYGKDMVCVIYSVEVERCPQCGAQDPFAHKPDCRIGE